MITLHNIQTAFLKHICGAQSAQDSLGGSAKTLMFVNVTPTKHNVGETLSSLNFAARARSVELGVARSNSQRSIGSLASPHSISSPH